MVTVTFQNVWSRYAFIIPRHPTGFMPNLIPIGQKLWPPYVATHGQTIMYVYFIYPYLVGQCTYEKFDLYAVARA